MRTENTGEFRANTGAIAELQKTIAGSAGIKGAQIWPAIGVMTAVLALVGGALYWPIKDNTVELLTNAKDHRKNMVPRAEHVEKWRQYDRDADRIERRVERLELRLQPKD